VNYIITGNNWLPCTERGVASVNFIIESAFLSRCRREQRLLLAHVEFALANSWTNASRSDECIRSINLLPRLLSLNDTVVGSKHPKYRVNFIASRIYEWRGNRETERSDWEENGISHVVTAILMCAVISHGGINFVYWSIGRREYARNERNAKNCTGCKAARREARFLPRIVNARKFGNILPKFSAFPWVRQISVVRLNRDVSLYFFLLPLRANISQIRVSFNQFINIPCIRVSKAGITWHVFSARPYCFLRSFSFGIVYENFNIGIGTCPGHEAWYSYLRAKKFKNERRNPSLRRYDTSLSPQFLYPNFS